MTIKSNLRLRTGGIRDLELESADELSSFFNFRKCQLRSIVAWRKPILPARIVLCSVRPLIKISLVRIWGTTNNKFQRHFSRGQITIPYPILIYIEYLIHVRDEKELLKSHPIQITPDVQCLENNRISIVKVSLFKNQKVGMNCPATCPLWA